MVKQEKNIHCTICGKTYSDAVAAHNHARKHTGKTQPALVMVMPQPHEAVGIQPTTSLTVPHGDTGAANHSSSQHAPPNPSVDARSNTRDVNLRIPQVGAPIRMSRSARGATKTSCPLCPHLKPFRTQANLKWHRKTFHAMIYKVCNYYSNCSRCPAEMGRKGMWKHMRDVHGATRRRRTLNKLRKTQANTGNYRKQTIPGGPSTSFPDEDGQLSSEDEESITSDDDDEGQSSPEAEQRYIPEARGERLAFSCDMCPDSFLTVETLTMHTKFVHRWRCGYCKELPPLTSVSLWREHRATVHGLVG